MSLKTFIDQPQKLKRSIAQQIVLCDFHFHSFFLFVNKHFVHTLLESSKEVTKPYTFDVTHV
jgi:hypothetical protein